MLTKEWMTTRLVSDHAGKTKPQARVTILGMEKIRAMLVADRGETIQPQLMLVASN